MFFEGKNLEVISSTIYQVPLITINKIYFVCYCRLQTAYRKLAYFFSFTLCVSIFFLFYCVPNVFCVQSTWNLICFYGVNAKLMLDFWNSVALEINATIEFWEFVQETSVTTLRVLYIGGCLWVRNTLYTQNVCYSCSTSPCHHWGSD